MTRADQLRQARLDMLQALQMGCSIPDMRVRRAEDRRLLRQRAGADAAAHTDDLMNGPREAQQRAFEQADCPWMMRD